MTATLTQNLTTFLEDLKKADLIGISLSYSFRSIGNSAPDDIFLGLLSFRRGYLFGGNLWELQKLPRIY